MKIHEVFGQQLPVIPRPSNYWPISDCRVGLEFEFENPYDAAWAEWFDGRKRNLGEFYKVVGDGSLRDGGIEMIFKEPLMGEQLQDAIARMCRDPQECPLSQTYRTSIHVHIDARDMEIEHLKSALLIYAMVESGMFAFVGQDRDSSNYSVPWYASTRHLREIADSLFCARNGAGIRDKIARIQRYGALNINALRKYGSLEFRHLGQTLDLGTINNWVSGCMHIKRAALAYSYDDVCKWTYEQARPVYERVFGVLWPLFHNNVTEEQHDISFATAGMLLSFLEIEQASKQIGTKFGKGENPSYETALSRLKERV